MKLKFAKPKKVKKTTLRNKADALFSQKTRSIGFCQAAGRLKGQCGGALQTCHIEGRSNYRLRWNPNNVVCMCMGHHRIAHTNPLLFFEFILEYYPEKYDFISKHKNETVKMTVDIYKELIKVLST